MENKLKNDRAGFLPYIVYVIYTVYMTIVSVVLDWPSWIIALINCCLAASLGLRAIYGKERNLPKIFSAVMIWINLLIYSLYCKDFTTILGSVAAAIVLLSLFDVIAINYISLIFVLAIFISNIILGKLSYDNPVYELEFAMQILAIVILIFLENNLLKNRIRRDNAFAKMLKELEDAQRGKDDFMANVSHEIRTPLNAIIGIGDGLLETNVDDATREKLYDISVAGRNLMSLVSDILDFTELQNDTMELVEEPYNITSIVNDVINMTNAWNKEKKLEFIVDCEADIPNCLLGDSQKIYRIIINLINNAIKFTDDGGIVLFVGTRKEEYGVNLMIKVQDTGIGMSEEALNALENSYNQVDTTRDRRSGGVGLGLAISRKMVSKMNGHMHISSAPDVGTTVSIIIPQKVLNDIPIVSVKNMEDEKILFYMDLERYNYAQIRDAYIESIQRMIDVLDIDAVRCSTVHELQQRVLHGSFDFLFMADIEYLKNKEYVDGLKDKLKVVIIVNRDFDTNLLGKNIQLIYRPLHVFSVATILNGEVLQQNAYEYRWNNNKFFVKGAKVLAVDDSAMNLKVVSGIMRRYGVVIETALSGKEAINKVENRHYDLIFMDHMMPEMDGVECMQKLRELPSVRSNKTPIIALTANAISGAREMLIREGFDDFVAKPIEKSSLEIVLKKYLSSFIVEKDEEEEIEVKEEVSSKGESVQESKQAQEGKITQEGRQVQEGKITQEGRQAQEGKITQEGRQAQEGKFIQDNKSEQESNSVRADNSSDKKQVPESEFNIPGIDYSLGLHYFDNDKESYMDIVKCFYEQSKEHIANLEKFYESKDWKNYKILIHSVKGMSLTIGAADLSEDAKQLQFAAEKEEAGYITANHNIMIEKYKGIISGLSKYMEADNASESLRQKLMTSFDEFDQSSSLEIIEKIKNGEDGNISDDDINILDKMKEYIDLFDFNSAAELLKTWGGEHHE